MSQSPDPHRGPHPPPVATGFHTTYTDVSTWIIPLGALVLVLMCLAGAIFWRSLLQYWVSGLLGIAGAASALAVVTSIYNTFHS
jgi:hypothetical protein